MKAFFLFIAATLIQLSVFAQTFESPSHLRIKSKMWASGDNDFATTKCNEKWKNESAVILCRKYEYSVKKEVLIENIYENIYSHKRILLNDKSAVENYSTFSFDISRNLGSFFGWGNNRQVYIGAKIVKPDGKEIEVNINKKLIDEINARNSSQQIQKVAIPNLEPGDIIDYYVASETTISGKYYYYGFSPVIYPLVEDYPIEKQKIDMHIMRKCYLSARSMNSAPELKLSNNDNHAIWSLVDTMRPKSKEQKFTYPLRELPVLLFQANYIRNSVYNNGYFFIDKEDKLKNSLTDSDFKTLFGSLKIGMNYAGESKILKFWRKNLKNENNPEILAREAYYFYREYLCASYYKFNIANNYQNFNTINDAAFVSVLSKAFRQKNIVHSIMVTVPREIGSLEDLVIRNQMGQLLKVYTINNPLYLTSFTNNSLHNQIDYSYQGNKAKSARIFNAFDIPIQVDNDSVPEGLSSDNILSKEMDVKLNPDSVDKLIVSEKLIASGWEKRVLQHEFISIGDRIKEYDKNRYNVKIKKVRNVLALQRLSASIANDSIDREKRVLDYFKEDFDNEHIKNWESKLIEPGIWYDKPNFEFSHKMEITGYTSQVGNNIMVDVGMLLGKQLDYPKKDTIRNCDIYIPYPKVLNYKISIAIPEGFKVKGLEALETKVGNEAGGFECKVKTNGNVIELEINKCYAKNYLPKNKWTLFQQFIDAANDFRGKKIMFVPVQ